MFLSFIVLPSLQGISFPLSIKPSETRAQRRRLRGLPEPSDGSDTLYAGPISVCAKAYATEGLFFVRRAMAR